ncbi:FtsX-like permease family protein [Fundicoccus culcitae]|uniref:FtsX-like permease family protein n=1 Tax=Fundicoccus culcitae TaxID=2969821 RepID=A0ABY5P500_9LACT|nr:FtsX-like permease family protein [Fundicoccus culcitae]UUX33786.1 FtsX-like permease family protein [Fundicoccus culcitae]
MTFRLLSQLAVQGMVKRRTIYFPYLLALVLIMALEYIMISLMGNEYVLNRHADLPTIIFIAVFFSTLLAVIFIIYANNFIQRQRRLEFALYTVLGLEDRHIRRIILIEQLLTWVITSVFAVAFGYVLGNIMFIGLNRLIQDAGAGLADYPFDLKAALMTSLIILAVLLLIYLINTWRIVRLNPTELLSQTHAGESEPKSRWLLLIIGLVTLGAGYYIALSINNVLDALSWVFVAILLVIFATYALFTSLSILVLKLMKRNKKYYYQPTHFLSISGMLYRMKANATSLSGIAILCTGIVLTLGTTLSLYLSMDDQVNSMVQRDFELNYYADETEESANILNESMNAIQSQFSVQNIVASQSSFLSAIKSDAGYVPYTFFEEADLPSFTPNDYAFLMVETLEGFNELNQTDYQLERDEVLFTRTDSKPIEGETLVLGNQNYQPTIISENYIPTNFVGNIAYIVVANEDVLYELANEFPERSLDGTYSQASINQSLYFDASDADTLARLEAYVPEDGVVMRQDTSFVRMISTSQQVKDLYELNGGFLFLGIIVGAVLILGTILMLYFKQVSEGYQDKNKYDIMQKVGLPDSLIKKTIRSQVFWVFALPIIIAIIHSLFASNVMYNLLGLFGLRDVGKFVLGYGSVLGLFVVVYYVFYLITSKVYYRIIRQG